MANCEKQVEQEAAYIPHPYIFIQLLGMRKTLIIMPHCPVTVVQRYRDGVYTQPLVPLVFHNLPSVYRRNFYSGTQTASRIP